MTIRHVYIVLLLPKGKSREIIINKNKKQTSGPPLKVYYDLDSSR